MRTIGSKRGASTQDARTFVLLNVLGFPAAAYVLRLILRGLVILGMPAVGLAGVATATGVALIGANVWLTWRAARAGAGRGPIVVMTAWGVLCAATLVLLGTFSPLTLALGFVFAVLRPW